MRTRTIIWLLTLALSTIHAQPVSDDALQTMSAAKLLEAGQGHFDAGAYSQAVRVLRVAFRKDPGSVDVNFLLGMAQAAAGNHEAATMAFDRVLIMDPNLPRVELELAKSYFALRLLDVAEGHFRHVLEGSPPKQVKENVELFLDKIQKERKRHVLAGSLAVSGVVDSNARVSPGGDVALPGLDDTITIPIERDAYTTLSLAVSHELRVKPRRRSWMTGFSNYNARYDTESDLDLNYFGLQSGPRFQFGDTRLDLRGVGTFVRKDYHDYLRGLGVSGMATKRLTDRLWLSLVLRMEDRKYYQTPQNNGFALTSAVMPTVIWGKTMVASSIGYSVTNADESSESFDKLSAGLRFSRKLPFRVSGFLGYRFDHALYDARGSFSTSRRDDDVHQLTVGLYRRLSAHIGASLTHSYTRAYSNADIYDYDRNVTSLSLKCSF
ncbi:MAG: DUF560 domain-containing protein [Lentisphaerae bacterium]|jgi:tetratricopeptide (TPR) repeat protein|nr:DUF560 domain-containing protein [Lentisphaerota bacterium]MBT4822313.1 DUF560 domain-containing protein [Lentisphaerota bacterium]MBT5607181.1 DUF560 domain-containing protein [Lentisphaerota bacterium]MBT7060907.1 DUF560 domain-containing protein [Lentisphaerota bacterium]MBT7846368.1 DUF560 domain-containing protein [Lentisphaerota bacterium]